MTQETTICALATATGGALGIIRISGNQSLQILSKIFSKNLVDAKGYSVHYGHIVDKSSNLKPQTSNLIDEVLVTVFRAPHSYTGEDSAEIS
ncbi:MAG: tRNA uridine-5-carboxymethylaminomethyl(34) synthesis GTPase MnmE, partial [Prevotella sp.]|nr:tRNA uridine-5-carboxymethylaminomethyl(34) synthesis GTPase MnmE [Prevotella sp.]